MYGKGQSPKIVAFDCGMKYNIIRYFVNQQKVQLTVVPYDYDLKVRWRKEGATRHETEEYYRQ